MLEKVSGAVRSMSVAVVETLAPAKSTEHSGTDKVPWLPAMPETDVPVPCSRTC